MGGRGGSSGLNGPQGRKMSMGRFFESLAQNNQQGMLDVLSKTNLQLFPADFTKNGNAIRLQAAEFEVGDSKIDISFHNYWEPMQVTKPTQAIKQSIEVRVYKNGNITALRTLAEKKSMSLKNAEKNYQEMLEQWKKLTKQKEIKFR